MDAYQFYAEILHFSDPALIHDLAENSKKRHYKKGDMIIHIGEIQKDIYFMESGLCRGYLLDLHGNELTDCFGTRCGEVALSPGPFTPDMVSGVAFEMLAEGDFFCVPITAVLEFLDKYQDAVAVYARMLNESAQKHWEQKRVLACYGAAQKYQWFLEEYPGLVDCVNIRHIASFLGMRAETLSRLRKTLVTDGGN